MNNHILPLILGGTILNAVLIIINLKKQKTMSNKLQEALEKLDALKQAVQNDEAAESQLLASKNAEIAELKQQLEDAQANAGLSSAEEEALASQINERIAQIEAEIKESGVEVPEEPEVPTEPEVPEEPVDPTEPTEPVEPETPVEPELPTQPQEPGEVDETTLLN